MKWLRRGAVSLLSLLLVVSLVDGAFAASAQINLSQPNKIETWLNQSNLYNSIVSTLLTEAQQSASNIGSTSISFHDDAVQQAAFVALPQQLVQQSVNTFLNSNYAWLQGKTSTPVFKIDLSGAKTSFADQVAQEAATRLNGLPVCTPAQLAQIQGQGTTSVNPFTIDCRPASVDPQAYATQLKSEILSSNFLANPVLTANQPDPNKTTQTKPYYQQLSGLPKAYQASSKLPWACGIVALLSVIGIFFLSERRRKGIWLVSWLFALSGIVLIATKFFSDSVVHTLEHHIFNSATVGQLQTSATTFLAIIEHHLVTTDMWFGIAYLIIAAVLVVGLLIFKKRKPETAQKPQVPEQPPQEPSPPTPPQPPARPRPPRPRLIQ